MLHVLVDKLAVVAFVLVGILLVEQTQVVGLVAVVLCGGEAELSGAPGLGECCAESSLLLSVLGQDAYLEGVDRLGEQVLVGAGRGLQEGALGLLGIFLQTVVEHAGGGILHVVGHQVEHRVLQRVGVGLVLHEDVYHVVGLFLVLVDDDDGLGIVGHGLGGDQCALLGQHDGREEFLDLLLHAVDVDVAHHDDALVVGAVPLLVVLLQEGALKVVDNLHQSDGHAVAVLGAGVELGQVALQHAHLGTGAQAPLLVDDATFLLYLLLLQQQAVGPVVEDEQAGVDDGLAHGGHVADVVDRLVDGGIGIEVGAELDADGLAPAQQFVALEMLGAVEGHVLQEVGQSALVVVLLDGAHALGDVELGALFGPVVVADVVGQSVVKFADADIGVDRYGGHLLCHSGRCAYPERNGHHDVS